MAGRERHSAAGKKTGPTSANRGCQLFDAWVREQAAELGTIEAALDKVSKALGSIDTTGVTRWRGSRVAPEAHRQTLAEVCGVPVTAWEDWEASEELEPKEVASDATERQRYALAPPRELGTTEQELRASAQRCRRWLEGDGLSPGQAAALEAKLLSALTSLARLEAERPLERHPDFADFTANILEAIKEAFGAECTPDRLRALAASMRRRGEAKRSSKAEAA